MAITPDLRSSELTLGPTFSTLLKLKSFPKESLRELLRINEGSVIELERLAGDPLDILANGTIIAKGEVVMIGERFGIRFTEVVDPKERVQNL